MGNNHNGYSHHTAGRIMISDVPTALENDLNSAVLEMIKRDALKFKTIDYVYVTDNDEKLIGIASIKRIISSKGNTKISEVMSKNLISVQPDTSDEQIADLAVKHNIKAIPVVKKGRLLGVVTNDRIMTTLNKALREGIIHLAGIHKSHLNYENTLKVPLFKSVLHRLPWLLIGLIGITIAAIFISFFENILEKHIVIAFFIPAIVYMSDAIGTQHQMLLVRDLALLGSELRIGKYLLKIILIGFLAGLIIGSLVLMSISIIWHDVFIAFVIGTSMTITLTVSSLTAFIGTYLINRLKLDPAVGSGPLTTIVSDVSSVVIYFLIASLLLGL